MFLKGFSRVSKKINFKEVNNTKTLNIFTKQFSKTKKNELLNKSLLPFVQMNRYHLSSLLRSSDTSSTDLKSSTKITSENGSLKLVLPLSSGPCVFPIFPHETVHDFINTIRLEDPSIKSIVFKYNEDFSRVAHTTTLEDLIQSDFIIDIDDNQHKVEVSNSIFDDIDLVNDGLHIHDIDGLVHKAYTSEIRKKLNNDPRRRMPLSEFYALCSEYYLTEKDAQSLLKALKYSGIVVHFPDNEELSQFIYLKTDSIFRSLTNSLNISTFRKSQLLKHHELQEIEKKLSVLDEKYKQYNLEAQKYAERMLYLGLGYLVVQFAVLGRMVWFDFNWDIMEPISFFITYTTVMSGYFYYLLTNKDYTYPDLKQTLANRKLRKLYIRNRFNWREWNELTQRRKQLLEELN